MTTNAHTPTPWKAEFNGGRGAWIKGANSEWSALACGDTDDSANHNAALIVKAVNSHDALVVALPAIFHALEETLGFASLSPGARENVEFVIAELAALKATGG